MLEISKQLFSKWNTNGVHYCHWKSNEHLMEGLNGITDLDVLLDDRDKEKGCGILNELKFLFCRSQLGSRYPNVEDWIGFDKNTGRLIHLHLHYRMITGHKGMKEYTLPWTKEVLASRILDEKTNVYISDPNYEIVTLYTRFGLKAHYKQISHTRRSDFTLGEDNIKEINYLKARIQWPSVVGIIHKYFGNDTDEMVALIKKPLLSGIDFIRLKTLAELNLKPYNRYSSFCVFWKTIFYHSIGYVQKLMKRCGRIIITRKTPSSKAAPIIAFLGQDGAGKSTVTKDIRKWLSWKLEVQQFYLGSGDHFQPWEKKMARKLHGSNNTFALLIRKWLPFSYLSKLSKHVYKTIIKANQYAKRGGIVLFDRYPQVEYIGINDGPKVRNDLVPQARGILRPIAKYYARKEEMFLKRAVAYSPNLVIKLILSPEESIRRKPHENYEMVKRKHEIITKLHFDNSSEYVVDATQDYDQELVEIKNIIWQHILK